MGKGVLAYSGKEMRDFGINHKFPQEYQQFGEWI